ncbi:fatty acid desaturase [Erythrobacter sp. JK5]|uniref:fatty acid desaturase n=1 Tax=Erythrobacter sp. JK5 TaxID=2829500 RepID=UPI001BA7C46B|nr:fatty acid desaturase [Erythrobacter sp. JK5]QUL38273.1 fatty acid desaturase [Erythrobacter sp. JK5]
MPPHSQRETAPDPKQLIRDLAAFRDPKTIRSLWEFAITIVPFIGVFAGTLLAIDSGYYYALALIPLAALLLLRLFIIQHDCGHGAYFPNRAGNDWLGRAIGVFTLTPYDPWRRSHALHHAGTGNLDARGFGDVDTLTIREFRSKPWLRRFGYRLYRHPAVLLGFGPAYLFLLRHRLPIGLMRAGSVYWISAMATNAATALLLGGLVYQFGLATTALVFLPTLLLAASMGVWLFYVQHQFEEAHWDYQDDWSFHDAALLGSTHLDLPPVLRWFTANIGIHHVHHLASRIPFYRLPEVLRAHPDLAMVNRYTARDSFRPLILTLWDEDRRKLVSFREAARVAA